MYMQFAGEILHGYFYLSCRLYIHTRLTYAAPVQNRANALARKTILHAT
jgi:hypothetical protein